MIRKATSICAALLLVAAIPASGQDDESGPRRVTIDVDGGAGGIAAGDLNGDGHLDLAVTAGGVTVLLGDGRGGFQALEPVAAGEHPVDVALADFDEDGDLDLAVANHDTEYISLLMGDGSGRLRPAADSPLQLGLDPHPHAVRAADIDRDGHIDLLVDERGAEAVRILYGRGDGSFRTPGTRADVGGDPYRGMFLADLNGDGRLDLITPNPREAAVLLGDTEGGFGTPTFVPATRPFGLALSDLNGDGRLDLVSASEGGQLEVLYGDGAGGFQPAERWRLPGGGKKIEAGDFDGDGIGDAAVVNWPVPEVLLLMGSRDEVTTVRHPAGENPWGLAAADLNADGCDDLAVGNSGSEQLLILLSRRAGDLCDVR